MNLHKLTSLDVVQKRVLVRMDFDVPEGDYSRIEASKETLQYLLNQNAKLILIGHKGRPAEAKDDTGLAKENVKEKFTLEHLAPIISNIIQRDVRFLDQTEGDIREQCSALESGQIVLLENLRFDVREEQNDPAYAQELASFGEVYVNEAFAVSHRAHASIVGIPKFLPHAAGLRLEKEIEMLSKVTTNPARPLLILISGIKDDKLKMVERMAELADRVLVAGRLPEYIEKLEVAGTPMAHNEKVVVAKLNPDKEDITMNTIELFIGEIANAKTIVLAGVVGKVEDEGHQLGTKRIFEAVASSNAYKVAGGGDTEAALTKFGLNEKFTWVSVGGGAMLEFLDKGTLPGIEALLN